MEKSLLRLALISNFAKRVYYALRRIRRGKQWCRIVMDQKTQAMIQNLPYQNFSVLEISGTKWANFGFKSYTQVQFPEFDLCNQVLPERYDLIIAEQVFEHLSRPYRAAQNVCQMLKPDGRFLITTPFMIKVHPFPEDCTRWTESGLKYFLAETGLDETQIQTGSWGNTKCVMSNIKKFTRYIPIWHSLKNEKDVPVVVWALAKKTKKDLGPIEPASQIAE